MGIRQQLEAEKTKMNLLGCTPTLGSPSGGTIGHPTSMKPNRRRERGKSHTTARQRDDLLTIITIRRDLTCGSRRCRCSWAAAWRLLCWTAGRPSRRRSRSMTRQRSDSEHKRTGHSGRKTRSAHTHTLLHIERAGVNLFECESAARQTCGPAYRNAPEKKIASPKNTIATTSNGTPRATLSSSTAFEGFFGS
jgi:hypothetical protein